LTKNKPRVENAKNADDGAGRRKVRRLLRGQRPAGQFVHAHSPVHHRTPADGATRPGHRTKCQPQLLSLLSRVCFDLRLLCLPKGEVAKEYYKDGFT